MNTDKNTTCPFETPQVIDYMCNYCGEYGHVQSFRIPADADLELDIIACVCRKCLLNFSNLITK